MAYSIAEDDFVKEDVVQLLLELETSAQTRLEAESMFLSLLLRQNPLMVTHLISERRRQLALLASKPAFTVHKQLSCAVKVLSTTRILWDLALIVAEYSTSPYMEVKAPPFFIPAFLTASTLCILFYFVLILRSTIICFITVFYILFHLTIYFSPFSFPLYLFPPFLRFPFSISFLCIFPLSL